MTEHGSDPIETLDVHVTAQDAYPAFERLFLTAQREVVAGFRVFDLTTRLRSEEARAVGDTWFDLFEHALSRGVNITLVVSDFDPVIATDYHRQSWETARQLAAAEVLADRGRLTFRIARHPARAGIIPRALLRPRVRDQFRKQEPDRNTPGLNELSEDDVFDLSPATHHQKLAVFDRETLYIGGLDLDERRYDTREHRRSAEDNWHDVQLTLTGPVVAAALDHLNSFEASVAGRGKPAPAAAGFLRTISAKRWPAPLHISPRTVVREVEEAHLDAIGQARDLIYLESQYLRHLPLATALARAAEAAPELRLIAVLPAAPEDVAFDPNAGRDARLGEHLQARAISRIADSFGARALVCSPA